jgi:hypothetical protein
LPFLPFLRAFESPMAIACLRLFTLPPRPLSRRNLVCVHARPEPSEPPAFQHLVCFRKFNLDIETLGIEMQRRVMGSIG